MLFAVLGTAARKIGIVDDVTFTSLPQKEEIALGGEGMFEAKFYGLNVTSNEVRSIYQVSRTDRSVTETQVRTSETTRLLGVGHVQAYLHMYDVTRGLRKNGSFLLNTIWEGEELANNRVLVGTYCAVSTQTVEFSFEHTFTAQSDFFFLRFLLNTIWEGEELAKNLPNKVKKYFAQNNISVYYIK